MVRNSSSRARGRRLLRPPFYRTVYLAALETLRFLRACSSPLVLVLPLVSVFGGCLFASDYPRCSYVLLVVFTPRAHFLLCLVLVSVASCPLFLHCAVSYRACLSCRCILLSLYSLTCLGIFVTAVYRVGSPTLALVARYYSGMLSSSGWP